MIRSICSRASGYAEIHSHFSPLFFLADTSFDQSNQIAVNGSLHDVSRPFTVYHGSYIFFVLSNFKKKKKKRSHFLILSCCFHFPATTYMMNAMPRVTSSSIEKNYFVVFSARIWDHKSR